MHQPKILTDVETNSKFWSLNLLICWAFFKFEYLQLVLIFTKSEDDGLFLCRFTPFSELIKRVNLCDHTQRVFFFFSFFFSCRGVDPSRIFGQKKIPGQVSCCVMSCCGKSGHLSVNFHCHCRQYPNTNWTHWLRNNEEVVGVTRAKGVTTDHRGA